MESEIGRQNADTRVPPKAGAHTGPAEIDKYAKSFGLSFAVAVLVTAAFFAIKVTNPELDEWAEEAFGHAWFYQAVLALLLFFGIGLVPIGKRLSGFGIAAVVTGSTVVSGIIILIAAAFDALA